jgi:hypothetical protein
VAAHAARMDVLDVPTIKSFPVRMLACTLITRGAVQPSLGCRHLQVPIACPRRDEFPESLPSHQL